MPGSGGSAPACRRRRMPGSALRRPWRRLGCCKIAPQGGGDLSPMRLQSEFQDRAQRDEKAEEEDDGEPISHSFSPDLSTAECSRDGLAPLLKLCSLFVLVSSGEWFAERATLKFAQGAESPRQY